MYRKPDIIQSLPFQNKRRDGEVKITQDLKVCDDDVLVQILCFWILSIVLSLSTQSPRRCVLKNKQDDVFR
jgi:hypothetical protein